MIGADIHFRTVTPEGVGICADTILKRRGQPSAGPQSRVVQKLGHKRARGPDIRPDFLKRRGERGRRLGMMIDNHRKIHVVECRAVMRLRIHNGETLRAGGERRFPFDHGNAQIAQHGQIVRARHFVDAADSHTVHPLADQPLKGKGSGNSVRVGADQHHPVVIPVEQGLQFGQT